MGRKALEQQGEMLRHASDRRRVEQIRVILQQATDRRPEIRHLKPQVELPLLLWQGIGLKHQIAKFDGLRAGASWHKTRQQLRSLHTCL